MSEQILRHPNGGASKHGTDVHVSADSFCDVNSRLYGKSAVIGSALVGSMVEDAQVFSSKLRFAHAVTSVVAESNLNRVCAVGCVLHRVDVLGNAGGEKHQMHLTHVVAENCELYGEWELTGNARIPCGVWHRAPRFCRITGDGVDVGLTESTDGHALMACWRKPTYKWLAFGPRLGRKHGWTEQQIKQARDFFTELADCPLPT